MWPKFDRFALGKCLRKVDGTVGTVETPPAGIKAPPPQMQLPVPVPPGVEPVGGMPLVLWDRSQSLGSLHLVVGFQR